jgi:hypothetical protein
MYLLALCAIEVHIVLTVPAAGRHSQLLEHMGLGSTRQGHAPELTYPTATAMPSAPCS